MVGNGFNQFDFKTPLHLAIAEGFEAIVDCLLTLGNINLQLTDRLGKTILHYAIEHGRFAILRKLLAYPDIQSIVNLQTKVNLLVVY